jgi:Septum formation
VDAARPWVAVVIVVAALVVIVPVAAVLLERADTDDDVRSAVSEVGEQPLEMPVADDGPPHPTIPHAPQPPIHDDDFWGEGGYDYDLWGPAGECVDTEGSPIDCSQPHMGEVFAGVQLSESTYPGLWEIVATGTTGCAAAYERLTGTSAGTDGIFIVPSPPSERAWDDGQRQVVCLGIALSGDAGWSITDG